MARLGNIRSLHRTVRASGLVEVLVAMVILLSVFAIGMLIFANLTRSSLSRQSKAVRLNMEYIQQQIHRGEDLGNPVVIDSVVYYIEEEILQDFPDHKKITIYAEQLGRQDVLDSLISMHSITAQ